MMSITTLTLNPTIDIAYRVNSLVHTDKIRATEQHSDPGGGGINIARVFVRMGGNARCVYLSGGPTGIALDALLDLHQLVREKVAIRGETRISSTFAEEASGLEYRIVPPGPEVHKEEWQACLDRLKQLRSDYLVMSGSLPLGVPADFYARAARIARQQGMRSILDTSGDALEAAMAEGGLDLVKPNLREFQQLVGQSVTDIEDNGQEAQKIAGSGGARRIAVSMGERGGVLASGRGATHIAAPYVETASSVGAGDSCLAAMVYGLALGQADEDAFRLGICAGAAALLTPGTNLARVSDIERLHDEISANA